jgi:hypothetical protein
MDLFNLLLLSIALPNKQLIIGYDSVKSKDLLLIEEVESSQSALADSRSLQMSNSDAFYPLQILSVINTMSIKLSILDSLVAFVRFK